MKGLLSKIWVLLLLLALFCFHHAYAVENQTQIQNQNQNQTILFPYFQNLFSPWRNHHQMKLEFHDGEINMGLRTILAGLISFVAASISSAGGLGGGGLYLPILNLVAGLDLKTATAFTAFMVTGGSVANVIYNLSIKNQMFGGQTLIDYDIALLSEPCMLAGVSVGVICNLVFPEWLITILFAIFLVFCTFKTCKTGCLYWKIESEGVNRNGLVENPCSDVGDGEMGIDEPLLSERREGSSAIPIKKLGILVIIWVCFFLVHVLRGDKDGESLIAIEPCGFGYWLISSIQIPLALAFTLWILYRKQSPHHQILNQQEMKPLRQLFFPLMALSSGILGGLFGIGGGMLINPVLLEIGVPPQITAATCSFMVLFSSSMSSVQYLMLGMKHVDHALILSIGCFFSSLLGLAVVQAAIGKQGRTSLIVFSVGLVMALSTALITSFGALDVWREYKTGQYMGFRTPC